MNPNAVHHLPDKYLIEKVLNGDAQAFGSIVKNTEKLVTQIVFKLVSDPEDRKDLSQEIYLKAYKKLPGFRYQSKLSTWIAQISYNTCLDHLRKKKLVLVDMHLGEADQEDHSMERLDQLTGSTREEIEREIQQKNIASILAREMEKLSPVYRTLLTLYHQEELSYEEIAHITGLPDGTVKSYLFRARKAMKNGLLNNYKKDDL